MRRYFITLYSLITLTLVFASFGEDFILRSYHIQNETDIAPLTVATAMVQAQLSHVPPDQWRHSVTALATTTGLKMELLNATDISGKSTLDKLMRGEVAYMQTTSGELWGMKAIDTSHILVLKSMAQATARSAVEWVLTVLFFTVMALVIMMWLWPLTRDLRLLESATARYGNRDWAFDINLIKERSQIYSLAQTFQRMATRIDGLVASHKDMMNALSHEIKTPLSRMQFEIELAQQSVLPEAAKQAFSHIKADVVSIDRLITATMSYAILDRADMALNFSRHDLAQLIAALTTQIKRDHCAADIQLDVKIGPGANSVYCDAYLLETALKNLVYNAIRYAKKTVRISFTIHSGYYQLLVEDDGLGIAEQDRQRVLEPFVQLDKRSKLTGEFGLGLALVKRCLEWHQGTITIGSSVLGGAQFLAQWPAVDNQNVTRQALSSIKKTMS